MAKKKTVKKRKRTDSERPSFEQSLGELERVVEDLESGELGLSDALARYEEGVKHLKSCQQELRQAERKIEILSGVDANGNPITEPFGEEESESLEEKAAARSARRSTGKGGSRKRAKQGDIDDVGGLF